MRRGEELILKSNSDNRNWELQSSGGQTRTLPGACFMIPPPDAEARDKVNRYSVQTHHLQFVFLTLFCYVMRTETTPVMDFNDGCLCAFSLNRALTDLKSRRSALMTSLKNPTVEVVRPQKAGEKDDILTGQRNFVFPGYKDNERVFDRRFGQI